MKITKFFQEDFNTYAIYDSYRSIGNYVDGLKPSSRKVTYTIQKNNIKTPLKVSQLASKIAEETEYLHGETSLVGVICGMAQNFAGTNNINLIKPEGSFGVRTIQEPSAPRYIYTCKEKIFDIIFNKSDNEILIEQEFEGSKIEPRFFLPIVPLILVNGSEGIGNGFAQKILPRNPKEIVSYIKKRLKNDKHKQALNIFYRDFKGECNWNKEGDNWIVSGKFDKLNQTTIAVTELPIGYDLETYKEALDKLEDAKVIVTYDDESEDNKFLFKIKVTREFMLKGDSHIYDKLKLCKKVSENFTCIDENNSIIEFDNAEQLIEKFMTIRLEYYQKRKDYLLEKIRREVDILNNRAKFIFYVIKGEIVIANKNKDSIVKQCEDKNLLPIDGNYDYLIGMQLWVLTKEKLTELKDTIIKKETELETIENTTINEMWVNDLTELEKLI